MTKNTAINHFMLYRDLVDQLGEAFEKRARAYDEQALFVDQNYKELKKYRFFSLLVPRELGGPGLTFGEVSFLLRKLAGYCPSTALALSMHQHLVAANVWKYRQGKGGEEVLRRVGEDQLILVSTGAKDWLDSNGKLETVAGGYLMSGSKYFASQSAVGDLLVTSAPYEDEQEGPQVFHFAIPFASEGLSLLDDWDTLGMRGTGSQTVKLDKVFIPEAAIRLRRKQGEFHPVWNVVLGVAMPLIMSVYAGIAEKAFSISLDLVKNSPRSKAYTASSIGEMSNQLSLIQLSLEDMLRINNNFDFEPDDEIAHKILSRKTLLAESAIELLRQSMEVCGGLAYRKSLGLERLFRDVQAARYHPLSKRDQYAFSGSYLLRK